MLESPVPEGFEPAFTAVSCAVHSLDGWLFTQRNPEKSEGGQWGFPTGKVQTGEPHAIAMARELWEETGLEASKGSPLTHLRSYRVQWQRADFIYHLYYLNYKECRPTISLDQRELVNYQWLSLENGLSLNLIPDAGSIIQDLIELKLC